MNQQFKLATYRSGDEPPFVGVVLGDEVVRLSTLRALAARAGSPLRCGDDMRDLFTHWGHDYPVLEQLALSLDLSAGEIERGPMQELDVCAPLVPLQTFCAIGNYRSHLIQSARQEASDTHFSPDERHARDEQMLVQRLTGKPYMCFKLPSTVAGPNTLLKIPPESQRVDWELELGVIIARRCLNVHRSEAMQCIAGYTMVNDITVRDAVFRTDVPKLGADWLQSKNAPGFLPIGPFIVPAAFIADPYALRMTLKLNGAVMQDEWVADMLFDIATQIEYVSRYAMLLPGDLICTGTPGGCGTHLGRFLRPGDEIEASITGLGTQWLRVATEFSRVPS
jgi:2-keto-4-pentenoate hydratase/2-oxohepta-3-ene-1,7-dioic acid hydratase in catechol pathway